MLGVQNSFVCVREQIAERIKFLVEKPRNEAAHLQELLHTRPSVLLYPGHPAVFWQSQRPERLTLSM